MAFGPQQNENHAWKFRPLAVVLGRSGLSLNMGNKHYDYKLPYAIPVAARLVWGGGGGKDLGFWEVPGAF